MSVELNKLRTTHDWTFNPSVMLANALTAFILNLVSGVGDGWVGPMGRGRGEGSVSPPA